MITEPTVFILGAGASKPYGYPTGDELIRNICSNEFKTQITSMYQDYFRPDELNRLLTTFNLLVTRLSRSRNNSIDLFLSRNQDIADFAKSLIAFKMFSCESNKTINNPTLLDYDWFSLLFDRLTHEIYSPEEINKFLDNKVYFITFNYDRSLENMFYEAFSNSFPVDINELITSLNIVHVYGRLSSLPHEKNGGINYGYPGFIRHVNDAARGLKIIYESRKGVDDKICSWLKSAKKIFFLGFGFLDENIEALRLQETLHEGQYIMGTCFGLTFKEIERNKAKIQKCSNLIRESDIILLNTDSKMFLRDYL